MGDSSTITEAGSGSAGGVPRCDWLFRALDAEKPLAPGARFALDGCDVVRLGRAAAEPTTTASKQNDVRVLELGVADPRMSTRHAQLTKVMRRWVVEDLESKNGVCVNGERVTRRELVEGDVLEVGRTFFVFRAALPLPGGGVALAGLSTLNSELEESFVQLAKVAASLVPVAITGPSGSGKELVAQAVHRVSGRKGAFVPVNCGALPDTLVESQLFGHKKGAFSGATEDRPGLVRASHGGTLFLDEIGDLPLEQQTSLLRVLQQKEVQPLGSTTYLPVDLRVVSATHRDLETQVEAGTFRDDLRARLTGYTVELPGLSERTEDLGLIISALLRKHAGEKADQVRLTPAAARALFLYAWPLNVRELEKALEAALALAGGQPIDVAHLPAAVRTFKREPTAAEPGDRKAWLEDLLRKHEGNVSAVARAASKERMQIQRWMKKFGLNPAAFKP
jgi:transcriptional regulator of acetoin/glycerol metabolism